MNTATLIRPFRWLLHTSVTALAFAVLITGRSHAQTPAGATGADLASFERRVVLSKELGATHVSITEDLPPALWQFDPPDDPYPAWFVYRPGLLKTFPPKEVQPFVNLESAEKLAKILEERCKILRKH